MPHRLITMAARFVLAAALLAGTLARIDWKERRECSKDFFRSHRASTPARVAVVLRGESFRNVGGQHMRGTCCALSVRHQRVIYESHVRFFEVLRRAGYAVDAFSATRPCTNTEAADPEVSNATETLRSWYGPVLRSAREDPLDRHPFSQLRNRHAAVALARDHAKRNGIDYAFVLVLRWDYVFHEDHWDASCVLDGNLHDARGLVPHEADADKILVVPAAFVPCFLDVIVEENVVLAPDPRGANYSLVLARPPRCSWDGCLEYMDGWAGGGHRGGACEGHWFTKLASTRHRDRAQLPPEAVDDPERDAAALAECQREDFLFKDHWRRCPREQRNRDGCAEI